METIRTNQQKISEFYSKIGQIREQIKSQITALPDNENVTKLSDNAFIMSSSDLSMEDFSPSFYDFKYQYTKINELLDSISPNSILNRLDRAIKDKFIMVNNHRVKLNPKVREYLKQIIGEATNDN